MYRQVVDFAACAKVTEPFEMAPKPVCGALLIYFVAIAWEEIHKKRLTIILRSFFLTGSLLKPG
jgi:hypothetical protein